MKTGSYSPAPQLAILLPHHDDFKVLLDFCEKEGDDDSQWVDAIRLLIAGIINNPNDAELWCDLSLAFGLWHLTAWRLLFVAHRIDPENIKYLERLAFTYNHLGDRKQAIVLLNKALAIAVRDEDRFELTLSKMILENQLDLISPRSLM